MRAPHKAPVDQQVFLAEVIARRQDHHPRTHPVRPVIIYPAPLEAAVQDPGATPLDTHAGSRDDVPAAGVKDTVRYLPAAADGDAPAQASQRAPAVAQRQPVEHGRRMPQLERAQIVARTQDGVRIEDRLLWPFIPAQRHREVDCALVRETVGPLAHQDGPVALDGGKGVVQVGRRRLPRRIREDRVLVRDDDMNGLAIRDEPVGLVNDHLLAVLFRAEADRHAPWLANA